MGAPHYTRRQTGPSPAGNDKRFDKIRKKPWSWPPSCYRGSDRGLTLYLAYVVEGHASACPQTVGVATLCGVVMRTLRGRSGWVAMVTVNKGKVKLPKGYKYVLYHLFVLFVGKKKQKLS